MLNISKLQYFFSVFPGWCLEVSSQWSISGFGFSSESWPAEVKDIKDTTWRWCFLTLWLSQNESSHSGNHKGYRVLVTPSKPGQNITAFIFWRTQSMIGTTSSILYDQTNNGDQYWSLLTDLLLFFFQSNKVILAHIYHKHREWFSFKHLWPTEVPSGCHC